MAIPEPKSKELVRKIQNDHLIKRQFKNFVKFLVDFNVIGYTSAFLIALSITKILEKFTIIIEKKINLQYDIEGILIQCIILILVTLGIYIFIEYIFYGYMYTNEVSIERKIEKVIDDNDTKNIKKKTKNYNNIFTLNKTINKLKNGQ